MSFSRPALREFQIISLISLLVFALSSIVGAQEKTSGRKSAPVPVAPGNSWEQDGLKGPVRRVRTETASVISKNGKLSEGPRVLTGLITYDWQGNRIDNVYYVAAGSPLTGKEAYKYDGKGNIVEMTMRDEKGEIIVQEVYTYEFDPMGNWTKMTTSVALIEGGKITFEPTEVSYRTIAYYRTDAVNKVIDPATQPAAAPTPTSAPASSLDTKVATEKQTGAQTATNAAPSPRSIAGEAPRNTPAEGQNGRPPVQSTSKPNTNVESKNSHNTSPVSPELKKEEPVAAQPTPQLSAAPRSRGVSNVRKAIRLPPPIWPENAKRIGTTGTVAVEVIIDGTGKVISARSVSGPMVLRSAAEYAARQARFAPTLSSGQPAQVGGIINYTFSR